MGKQNIAEMLKDCPKGMELDSTIVNGLYFDEVTENNMIKCYTKRYCEPASTCNSIYFYSDGSYLNHTRAKCVIFPKGKTTWEGFQRPFKDGDVVYIQGLYEYIVIYKKTNCKNLYKHTAICISCNNCLLLDNNFLCYEEDVKKIRFATEEEKQKLFDAIKANGYKWNAETKTLEKLIEPKFKVGDRIKGIKTGNIHEIIKILSNCYIANYLGLDITILFDRQDEYELIPNKFDITTLMPFDKVLVRDNNKQKWTVDMFGFYDKTLIYPFNCIGHYVNQCIPYESNEYLLGTTNDCDEYYKNWE